MSVTAPSVPVSLVRLNVAPSSGAGLPCASLNAMVTVALPSVVIEAGETMMVEVDGEAAPTPTVTCAMESMDVPSTVALIVAVPGTGLVKTAV